MWSGAALVALLAFGIPPGGVTVRPEAIPQLEALAARHTRHGRFREAVEIYRRLAAGAPVSPQVCAWQASVVTNAMMGGTNGR